MTWSADKPPTWTGALSTQALLQWLGAGKAAVWQAGVVGEHRCGVCTRDRALRSALLKEAVLGRGLVWARLGRETLVRLWLHTVGAQ